MSFSPVTKDVAYVDDNRVRACGCCRKSSASASRNRSFVPTLTEQYASCISHVNFSHLHETSLINVFFKLVTHAHGYVSGEWCEHSLVNASLLVGWGLGVAKVLRNA